jgi:SAM-dependent methyltransferase
LSEPLPFLQSAVQLVKPGGRLLLAVPDADGWMSRSTRLLDLPPHHVLRWNPTAMRFLTEIFPLEVETVTVEPLDRVHVRDFVGSYLHPRRPVGQRPSFGRRVLARLVTAVLSISFIRKRLPGQSLIAVFRRRTD